MLKRVLMLSILLVAPAVPTSAASERPSLHFRVFARTGIRLTDVVWTGTQFLYVENTTNAISAAGPAGTPVHAEVWIQNDQDLHQAFLLCVRLGVGFARRPHRAAVSEF